MSQACFLLVAIALLLPAGVFAADAPQRSLVHLPFCVDGDVRAAGLSVPPEYDSRKQWPLIVYLHGGDGNGDTSGDEFDAWLRMTPIIKAIEKNPERFPALVLIPRCPPGKIWAPIPSDPIQSDWRLKHHGRNPVPDAAVHITKAIDAAISAYSIDRQRITLTGYSMGGEGATRYAALNPDRIAGVAPLAGSAVIVLDDAPTLSRMGVWMFQGESDEISTAELARRLVASLRGAGGTPRYTEYKDAAHDIAQRVYTDEDVIEWLLNQKKASTELTPMMRFQDTPPEPIWHYSRMKIRCFSRNRINR